MAVKVGEGGVGNPFPSGVGESRILLGENFFTGWWQPE